MRECEGKFGGWEVRPSTSHTGISRDGIAPYQSGDIGFLASLCYCRRLCVWMTCDAAERSLLRLPDDVRRRDNRCVWSAEEYGFIDEPLEEPAVRGRDPKTDEAKEALTKDWFGAYPNGVFYLRQIEVTFERQFYHWITSRALAELVAERRIQSLKMRVAPSIEVRFYWSNGYRYWRRQANGIGKLVASYSTEEVGRALGHHGETMFDVALPRFGFMPVARNTRSYGDRTWTETSENFDRIFVRDGVSYGVEIKNTLDYIPSAELDSKLAMCAYLGLRPLFIMRQAAKSYNYQIIQAGGYSLLFEHQMYPLGYEPLARELKERLGLKVDCPRNVEDGLIQKFLSWHQKHLGGGVKV